MASAWNEQGGGGYYMENEAHTPSAEGKGKQAIRQSLLCPVTVRMVHESPEDGFKVGNLTASMVTLAGIVANVAPKSTCTEFTLSDDTGVISCAEWVESEDGEAKKTESLMENNYYRIYGSIKIRNGQKRMMVFSIHPIEDFNEYTAFLAEVLIATRYAAKVNAGNYTPMDTSVAPTRTLPSFDNNPTDASKSKLSPQQKEVLDTITAVESQIGWDKKDPILRKKYSPQQLDAIIDYLIGEGFIYTTVDDDHFSPT